MSLPFGVSQFSTWPLTFEQDLALYRELGVTHIEICEGKLDPADPDAGLQRVREAGLVVTSVQPRLHSLFPDGPHPEPGDPGSRVARIRDSIRLVSRHFPGTPVVSITGAAPQSDYAAAYRLAVREYRQLAEYAAGHGVRLALEPLNPILMNIDTFICSLEHARRIVEAVDHPDFGIWLDVWHIWEDPTAAARILALSGKVLGVHINDWKTPRAIRDRYLPGAGEIPLVELIRAVRSTGYEGVYTLEVFSDLALTDSLWADPRGTIERARTAFERIWREACA